MADVACPICTMTHVGVCTYLLLGLKYIRAPDPAPHPPPACETVEVEAQPWPSS